MAMPLVIPKSGKVQYIRSEEVLGEILGHSNFDGEDWAIGDRLIFEDGTESRIIQEPDELYYIWDESTKADFDQIKQQIGLEQAANWADLFKTVELNELQQGLDQSIRRMPKLIVGVIVFSGVLTLTMNFLTHIWPWLLPIVSCLAILVIAAYAGDIRYYRNIISEAKQLSTTQP